MHAEVSSTAGISNVLATWPFQTRVTRKTAVFLVSRTKPPRMSKSRPESRSAVIVPRNTTSESSNFAWTLASVQSQPYATPTSSPATQLILASIGSGLRYTITRVHPTENVAAKCGWGYATAGRTRTFTSTLDPRRFKMDIKRSRVNRPRSALRIRGKSAEAIPVRLAAPGLRIALRQQFVKRVVPPPLRVHRPFSAPIATFVPARSPSARNSAGGTANITDPPTLRRFVMHMVFTNVD